jgi:ABC-type branched-subunit amino acid transport system substrate-binding protein/glycosylphosphatidylinositol transamidase (GPIT) subunit GPI8
MTGNSNPARHGRPLSSRALAVAVTFVLLMAGCTATPEPIQQDTYRIGVMLDMSGTIPPALQWAVDNVNAAGGVAGRPLELVPRDLAEVDLAQAARELAADPQVLAVIGPDSSAATMTVAGLFTQSHKVLVTPSATSGSPYRAFSGSPFFWRTVESDIAQLRTLLLIAAREGADSVALLTSDGPYGETFFDLFGFTATELGLAITGVHRYALGDTDCEPHVDEALAAAPDVLIAVPDGEFVEQAACMVSAWRAAGTATRLLFPDGAEDQQLIDKLGPAVEGLRGTSLVPDADNGFIEAFEARFGVVVPPYAANMYDAVLIIAYGLARSGGEGGQALAEAMRQVVDGRGEAHSWDEAGIAANLATIAAGELPDIAGATGPLEYDARTYTDLVSSTYRLWEIRGGAFTTVEYLTTADSPTATNQRAAFNAVASERHHAEHLHVGGQHDVGPRSGLWAVLVAASSGWDNYRHQADVYAQYQTLRANGVPDERIIVIAADDLADNPNNPEPGVIRYQAGGANTYADRDIDYDVRELTADDVMAILAGQASDALPTVVTSTGTDDVYVFVAGHGNEAGVYFGLDEALPADGQAYSILTPELLAETVDSMADGERFRRILIAVESCHGGVLGTQIDAPGAVLVAGANPYENSLSTNFDPASGAWLADEFAFRWWHAMTEPGDRTLRAVMDELYLDVNGSHVSAFGPDIGDVSQIDFADFVAP